MKKIISALLLLLSFNAIANVEMDCLDAFNYNEYNLAYDLCYSESEGFIFDNGTAEIIERVDGNPDTHFILGYMFQYGLGVMKNDWAAVYWYTKAADKGHLQAQYELGELYFGKDDDMSESIIPMNLGMAQYYLQLACEQGHRDACKDYKRILSL